MKRNLLCCLVAVLSTQFVMPQESLSQYNTEQSVLAEIVGSYELVACGGVDGGIRYGPTDPMPDVKKASLLSSIIIGGHHFGWYPSFVLREESGVVKEGYLQSEYSLDQSIYDLGFLDMSYRNFGILDEQMRPDRGLIGTVFFINKKSRTPQSYNSYSHENVLARLKTVGLSYEDGVQFLLVYIIPRKEYWIYLKTK